MKSIFFVLLSAVSVTDSYAALSNYEILNEARKVDSSYLCRAVADGNTFGPIYRSVLDERKHSCRDGLVVNDSDGPLATARNKLFAYARQQDSSNLCSAIASISPNSSSGFDAFYSAIYREVLNERNDRCPVETNKFIVDDRARRLNESFIQLLGKAQVGKSTYLKSARAHRENFFSLYPEHKNNIYVNEYLSYMAMLGEQVDLKKLTESQAQYELAKKNRELFEQAEKATQKQRQETDAVRAQEFQANLKIEQAAMLQKQQGYEQERIKAEAEQAAIIQKQQERQVFKSNLLNLGLQILQWNHESSLAAQSRRQLCIWTRSGTALVQNCN